MTRLSKGSYSNYLVYYMRNGPGKPGPFFLVVHPAMRRGLEPELSEYLPYHHAGADRDVQ